MIPIPYVSLKTQKNLLCIFLIVQTLVFMWRQRVYSRFVMSIVPSPFVSLILISYQFKVLVSKHIYTWSVVWDGNKWWFCYMLTCSFIHFYFYVNIYSLLSSLHWCLKYHKKMPTFSGKSEFCTDCLGFVLPYIGLSMALSQQFVLSRVISDDGAWLSLLEWSPILSDSFVYWLRVSVIV